MKDFLREYGRLAAIVAAAAFVLSFFVGLFSGNPFGTALLRAFLLAVVFAGIGVGLAFVVKKFLPELLEPSARSAVPPRKAEAERHSVDIVLPEESPVMAEDSGEPEELEDVESAESASPVEAVEQETAETVEAAEEVPAGTDEPRDPDLDGDLEAVSEPYIPPADSGGEEHPALKRQASGSVDSLDSLPDFGDLGTVGGAPKAGGAPSLSGGKFGRPSGAAQSIIGEERPESLAKAIRTVIKRDERG